jgi:hypothetical protein
MTPKPLIVGDEVTVSPSPAQKIIWKQWAHNWDLVAKERKNSRLIMVQNGDPVEGMHHQSPQVMTMREDEHVTIAIHAYDWAMKKAKYNPKKGDKYYQIAGTEAHGGTGGRAEEALARDFRDRSDGQNGVVPQWEKQIFIDGEPTLQAKYTWGRLLRKVNGVLFDIAHHGASVGKRAWTTSNSLMNTIKSIYFECLEKNQPIPRYWVRAHYHQYVHAYYEGKQGIIEGFVLPSYQLPGSAYVRKFNGGSLLMADIGMVYWVVEDNGSSYWKKDIITMAQDEIKEF